MSVLYIHESVAVSYIISLVSYFTFPIKVILDDICLSLPDLLHFTSRSIDTAVNGIISFFFKRNGSFDLAFLTSLLGDSYTH